MGNKSYSQEINVFHNRATPEPGKLAGYGSSLVAFFRIPACCFPTGFFGNGFNSTVQVAFDSFVAGIVKT